ncbi:hypothetical protein FRX94_13095 [Corynebacterium canis]|uniref:Uncharacterized protein n=1 Tax=Corynebacterium canis TaxID=679663 RepID=A0A5C5TTY3_9CORY|nr:hypothetical protein [Corynebacterium canis]TWT16828.1 hypothetical protein FRX94_13095 [Corynebacterium canis]
MKSQTPTKNKQPTKQSVVQKNKNKTVEKPIPTIPLRPAQSQLTKHKPRQQPNQPQQNSHNQPTTTKQT